MKNIDELIEISENMEVSAKGGNKKCYIIGDYALLKGPAKPSIVENTMQRQKMLRDKGINITPILEYKQIAPANERGFSSCYLMQEKSRGSELYKNKDKGCFVDNISSLSKENQSFYDKLISDWIAIKDAGLTVDPSKSTNFFYEKGKGINFIDNEATSDSGDNKNTVYEALTVLTAGGSFFGIMRDTISLAEQSTIIKATNEIINKVEIAAQKQGLDNEFIFDNKRKEELLSCIEESKAANKIATMKDKLAKMSDNEKPPFKPQEKTSPSSLKYTTTKER